MSKFIESVKSIKTTVLGILVMIPSLLFAFGVIDLTQKEGLEQGIPVAVEGLVQAIEVVFGIIGAVSGLGFLFAKDGDK